MYKYTKIETPFKRDMDGTKKLIEGWLQSKLSRSHRKSEYTHTFNEQAY